MIIRNKCFGNFYIKFTGSSAWRIYEEKPDKGRTDQVFDCQNLTEALTKIFFINLSKEKIFITIPELAIRYDEFIEEIKGDK